VAHRCTTGVSVVLGYFIPTALLRLDAGAILCSQHGRARCCVRSGQLVGRTVMMKKILELLALKWLWDRRKGRR
jgi:hypothetical protein